MYAFAVDVDQLNGDAFRRVLMCFHPNKLHCSEQIIPFNQNDKYVCDICAIRFYPYSLKYRSKVGNEVRCFGCGTMLTVSTLTRSIFICEFVLSFSSKMNMLLNNNNVVVCGDCHGNIDAERFTAYEIIPGTIWNREVTCSYCASEMTVPGNIIRRQL